MPDDLESLRSRWTSLFDEVMHHGRTLGRKEALESLMANIQAQLSVPTLIKTASEVVLAGKDDEEDAAKRAPPGFVQKHVENILHEKSMALTPMAIAEISRSRGVDLKESSIRMALQSLEKKHRARSIGRGEWHGVFIQLPGDVVAARDLEDATTRSAEDSSEGDEEARADVEPEFLS